jgi:hypothetical protein
MAYYMMILLIPIMAWLDYQRGLPKDIETITKPVALVGIGFLTATLTGHWFDYYTIAITLGISVIHGIGFGEPIGHALSGIGGQKADDGSTYESWQVGALLKENPWAALFVRGSMLGIAGLPTIISGDYLTPISIAMSWGIAFPSACALVRWVIKPKGTGEGENAAIRGGIAASLLCAIAYTGSLHFSALSRIA